NDEVDARGRGAYGRGSVDASQARRPRLHALRGLGPVVGIAVALPRREPAHVRPPLLVAPLELLGRGVVVVPLVLLGDPEVDERAVPEVSERHSARNPTSRRERSRLGRTSRPPRRRRGSP